MMTRVLQPLLLATCLLAAALDASAQSAPGPPAVLAGDIFGTDYRIMLPGGGPDAERGRLQRALERVLERVDAAMSHYREDSELSRLNAASLEEWIELSRPLYEVLSISQQVAAATGGAFDVTVGGLVELWGFGPEQRPRRVPSSADLSAALAASGYRRLELHDTRPAARRMADFRLDLSGVAKGYAVDAVARHLEARGVERYLVDIGGDLRAGGGPGDRRPWRVGVQRPDAGPGQVQETVPLADMALATSGDYRNYFAAGGRRYSHIIDPRDGRPIRHALASVTVLHPSAAWADAYATALMVLGPEAAMAAAERRALKALLIIREDAGFRTRMTPALERFLDADSSAE